MGVCLLFLRLGEPLHRDVSAYLSCYYSNFHSSIIGIKAEAAEAEAYGLCGASIFTFLWTERGQSSFVIRP